MCANGAFASEMRELEAQAQAAQAAVDFAVLRRVNGERFVAQILHGLEHGGVALGHDDGAVDPNAVGGISLVLGNFNLVVLLEVGLGLELARNEHVVVFQVVHAGLQVQHVLERHHRSREAVLFQDGEELLDNQDLCLLLKVAPRTLTRYRKKGILPFLMLDGRCYYRATDVHKLIREKTD